MRGKFCRSLAAALYCEGGDRYFSAMGNNPWPNAYFVLQMPNPGDVDYQLPFAMNWQMRQDEAMVLIGQIPPPVRYFDLRPGWASDVFVAFRNYLEPATAVSADSNELVCDRAIYFGPYFSEQHR